MKELLTAPTDVGPSTSQAAATDAVGKQVKLFLVQPNIPLESCRKFPKVIVL